MNHSKLLFWPYVQLQEGFIWNWTCIVNVDQGIPRQEVKESQNVTFPAIVIKIFALELDLFCRSRTGHLVTGPKEKLPLMGSPVTHQERATE